MSSPPPHPEHFRDSLRDARAGALRDAEGFEGLVWAFEKLGSFLLGHRGDFGTRNFGAYCAPLTDLANLSSLAEAAPCAFAALHTRAGVLLKMVKEARNDAMHEGVYARRATAHAVELALILEDALRIDMNDIGNFMVRAPVCAELWHPISFVRHLMLSNSFSYLPFRVEPTSACFAHLRTHGDSPAWYVVADRAVAAFLVEAAAKDGKERKELMFTTLERAILTDAVETLVPILRTHGDSVGDACREVLGKAGVPVLVHDEKDPARLLGIVTAFDLL